VPWYIDTSAFVKLASAEDHSEQMRLWAETEEASSGVLLSSDLLRTEAVRATRRSDPVALGAILDRLRRMVLLPMSTEIFRHAGELDPVLRRSLDALHLAAALSLGDDLSGVVTYDVRMAHAARDLGIPTATP
jgi:uncharacterized protein